LQAISVKSAVLHWLALAVQGLDAITAARCDALWQLHGAADEHLRWTTGSCTQADDATAALLTAMTATEQELACLHADALLLLQRLQLAAGLREAAAKAQTKRDQLLASTVKRDLQADIFGPRTQKEKRLDEAAVGAAGRLPSSNEVSKLARQHACRLYIVCTHCSRMTAVNAFPLHSASCIKTPNSQYQCRLCCPAGM
jgi:hypothetical protein